MCPKRRVLGAPSVFTATLSKTPFVFVVIRPIFPARYRVSSAKPNELNVSP